MEYLSGAANELLPLKAPVSTFKHITRVESLTDQGFSPVLVLESSVRSVWSWGGLERRTTTCAPLFQRSDHGQTNRSLPPVCRSGHCRDKQHCRLGLLHFKEGLGDGFAARTCEGILQFCRHRPEPLCGGGGCVLLLYRCLADLVASALLHS
ncbi:hypothetical protein GOODEAATRI_034655, partial [Goodea atripinnis]